MLLKDVYNAEFINHLSLTICKFSKNFDKQKFIKLTINNSWQEKSLKERMRAISTAIGSSLIIDCLKSKITILKKVIVEIEKDKNSGLSLIIFPDFIEVFCQKIEFDLAMESLEFFTEYASSEFAVRKFIEIDQKRAFYYLEKWSKNENFHIRRLSSECCRPLLPWGKVLQNLKINSDPIFTILENLKFDSEKYVIKSVANNLNDISKNHPQLVLELIKNWKKQNVDEFLVKHSLRTLLKQGNILALGLIGVESAEKTKNFTIKSFSLEKTEVNFNEYLRFSLIFQNNKISNKLRIEYAIYFLRKNGALNKKVFQITTKNFEKGVFEIKKKHLFKNLSVRKHYCGTHFVSLIVNGLEIKKAKFNLISSKK